MIEDAIFENVILLLCFFDLVDKEEDYFWLKGF